MFDMKISCIIPILNEEVNIKNFLESYLKQSKRFHELIIVDSNSSDKTHNVINSYIKELPELQVIVIKKRGTSLARNTGLNCATGDGVIFMDADWTFTHPYTISQLHKYPVNSYIIVRNTYPIDYTGLRKYIYIKDKDVSLKIIERKSCPVWDESLGYGEDKDFSNKFHKLGFELYEVDDGIVGLSRANGDMNLNKFIRRYKWYGRTFIPYLIKTKDIKQGLGYLCYTIPLLWFVPFARGFDKGFWNIQFGLDVIYGMTLVELISAFGIMLGTIEYMLGQRELGRDY